MAITVNFIGRLGRDAERHDGKNGGSFVSFNIAVDEYNPETKQNDTVWIRVTDGTERTLNMIQYLKKGTMLNIVGTERVSIYNGQNGAVINRDVRAFNWDFVRSGKQDSTDTTTTTSAPIVQNVVEQVQTTMTSTNDVATTGTFVQPTSMAVSAARVNADDDLPF